MEHTVRAGPGILTLLESERLVGESTACPVVVLVPLCVHARGGTDETSEYGIPTWDDVRRTCVEAPVGCAMCVTYYEYMSEGGGEGSNIFISCFVRRRRAAGSHPSRGAYICTARAQKWACSRRCTTDFEANVKPLLDLMVALGA